MGWGTGRRSINDNSLKVNTERVTPREVNHFRKCDQLINTGRDRVENLELVFGEYE